MDASDITQSFEDDWRFSSERGAPLKYSEGCIQDIVALLAKRKVLGPVVMDLGCGPAPISDAAYGYSGAPDKGYWRIVEATIATALPTIRDNQRGMRGRGNARILVDNVPQVHELSGKRDSPLTLCTDLNMLDEHSYQTQLANAYRMTRADGISTVVAAAVMNYVDFRKLFRRIDRDIAPGGLVIAQNATGVGYDDFFSDERPMCHHDIFRFFQHDLGYYLALAFPDRETYMVAQKPGRL